jgi:hypothetical protein
MASFRKNEASATANELLSCLSAMKSEYANLRAFADAMKLENADELFADMQGKIEEAETLYRTFLPTVKATSDHFAAVKSVLNSFWNEINGAKGDGSGVTQIFLFGASTTTTASYPTLTHFPFQGMGYEFDEYFWGAKAAQDKYGIYKADIAKCCKGKLKSAGKHPVTGEKLHWVYADEMNNSFVA